MSGQTFTIGELAGALTGGNEKETRALLHYDAGAGAIDVYAVNPSEAVSRYVVIRLAGVRAGDRVGRKCAELLSNTNPAAGE